MIKNIIPNLEIKVSLLGLGTVKFGRNSHVKYPTDFTLPSDNDISNLLALAKDLGINLLDTAPAYGSSEERLGKLIANRQDWVIATKAGENFINGQSYFDFSKTAIIKNVEQSLNKLNTDYLDIVLVHSNGDDEKIILKTDVFSVLAELKKSGKIRAFGMSTKTVVGGKLAIENSDIAMVTYNPYQQEEKQVIEYAHKNQKGIFIKKALASGHINKFCGDNPIKTSLDFIAKEPGVSSIILGTINEEHLKFNVECLNNLLLFNK